MLNESWSCRKARIDENSSDSIDWENLQKIVDKALQLKNNVSQLSSELSGSGYETNEIIEVISVELNSSKDGLAVQFSFEDDDGSDSKGYVYGKLVRSRWSWEF